MVTHQWTIIMVTTISTIKANSLPPIHQLPVAGQIDEVIDGTVMPPYLVSVRACYLPTARILIHMAIRRRPPFCIMFIVVLQSSPFHRPISSRYWCSLIQRVEEIKAPNWFKSFNGTSIRVKCLTYLKVDRDSASIYTRRSIIYEYWRAAAMEPLVGWCQPSMRLVFSHHRQYLCCHLVLEMILHGHSIGAEAIPMSPSPRFCSTFKMVKLFNWIDGIFMYNVIRTLRFVTMNRKAPNRIFHWMLSTITFRLVSMLTLHSVFMKLERHIRNGLIHVYGIVCSMDKQAERTYFNVNGRICVILSFSNVMASTILADYANWKFIPYYSSIYQGMSVLFIKLFNQFFFCFWRF